MRQIEGALGQPALGGVAIEAEVHPDVPRSADDGDADADLDRKSRACHDDRDHRRHPPPRDRVAVTGTVQERHHQASAVAVRRSTMAGDPRLSRTSRTASTMTTRGVSSGAGTARTAAISGRLTMAGKAIET